MARRPRIVVPGVPVHVIQRGNNRTDCFYAERDYRLYLAWLKELAVRFACAVHAYVLMTNHVHLLLTPEEPHALSLLMKHLGQRHAQHVNRRYGRSGTLWEGRFRSCVIEEEAYLLACHRYIELNPVRAAMVAHPRAYPWSSYRCNAEGRFCGLLKPHEIYSLLGSSDAKRRSAYRELFHGMLEPSVVDAIRKATNANVALGHDAFRTRIEHLIGRRAGPGLNGRPRNDRASAGGQFPEDQLGIPNCAEDLETVV